MANSGDNKVPETFLEGVRKLVQSDPTRKSNALNLVAKAIRLYKVTGDEQRPSLQLQEDEMKCGLEEFLDKFPYPRLFEEVMKILILELGEMTSQLNDTQLKSREFLHDVWRQLRSISSTKEEGSQEFPSTSTETLVGGVKKSGNGASHATVGFENATIGDHSVVSVSPLVFGSIGNISDYTGNGDSPASFSNIQSPSEAEEEQDFDLFSAESEDKKP